ncbi:MAG: hypothetical protein IPJ21_17460 [Sterolibacteriaceae bacterium]|nr:hypothetical protein [Sterolibacteriaceae bacterium]
MASSSQLALGAGTSGDAKTWETRGTAIAIAAGPTPGGSSTSSVASSLSISGDQKVEASSSLSPASRLRCRVVSTVSPDTSCAALLPLA